MTAPADKNLQSRGKHHSVSARSKPTAGKGRKTLEQYKADQRAALDAFKKACGG